MDSPLPDRSKYISGQGMSPTTSTSPYSQGTCSRAATSTPNLVTAQLQRSISPTGSPFPGPRRVSPTGITSARPSGPEGGTPETSRGKLAKRDRILALTINISNDRVSSQVVPLKPPPRSPLRANPPRRIDDDHSDLFTRAVGPGPLARASVADSTRVLVPDSARASLADPIPILQRQSTASGTTDTTNTTMMSSILEIRRNNNSSGNNANFGTVRTMTTEATSEAPSSAYPDGSPISGAFPDDLARKRVMDKHSRERRTSEAGADLLRVLEEVEECQSGMEGGGKVDKGKAKAQGQDREKAAKINAIQLGKGKWPDDFFTPQVQSPIPASPRSPSQDDIPPRTSSPLSISSPRKLAIVGASRRNESLERLPDFPRRPLHRPRHSTDTPGLLPKESILPRDASPDGIPGRVMLRRHKVGAIHNRQTSRAVTLS